MLAWVFDRVAGTRRGGRDADRACCPPRAASTSTASTWRPSDMAELLRVDAEEWRAEVPSIEEHYANLGERLPVELRDELQALEKRLSSE